MVVARRVGFEARQSSPRVPALTVCSLESGPWVDSQLLPTDPPASGFRARPPSQSTELSGIAESIQSKPPLEVRKLRPREEPKVMEPGGSNSQARTLPAERFCGTCPSCTCLPPQPIPGSRTQHLGALGQGDWALEAG